jgi:hypothetical protein
MTLSRLMSDCKQSDTREFAAGWSKTGANLLAAQPVRSDFQHPFAGLFSGIQIASDLNVGSTGLRSGLFSNEQGPYPLRT